MKNELTQISEGVVSEDRCEGRPSGEGNAPAPSYLSQGVESREEQKKRKACERARAWYRANTGRAKASNKARYLRCREQRKQANKEWALAHPEQSLKIKARYREKHREELNGKQRKWAHNDTRDEYGRLRTGWLRAKYGLTPAQYVDMVRTQSGVCKICGKPNSREGKPRRLAVDHCHRTGKVRGLLCERCNTAIGKLGDGPELVERALKYLRGEL